jgi:anthranilate synthase component 2
MILFIDNYDSFTYNLVQYIGEMDADVRVVRNDKLSVAEALALKPARILVSPGPCTPAEAGISVELIRHTPADLPLLGVCLGHQSLGAAFGAKVSRAPKPMHGKTSRVKTDGHGLFAGLPNEFTVTRYHSLIVEKDGLPKELQITAEGDGLIMGLRHQSRSLYGLQFHPESILTEHGKAMLKNFLQDGN